MLGLRSSSPVDTRASHNETEQKIMNNSETKMSRKKKDKGVEIKEPVYSQAQIDKISLPLRLYNRLE